MILELSVENLAILERAQVALGPGLTVLTGETGAGKSLLVDAIELAFGARADSDLVRAGATRATVSVAIDLSDAPAIRAFCDQQGHTLEGDLLLLQREVFVEGRSQCRIGGRLASVGAMRELGRTLVDLHGQHDHQSLLDPSRHIEFLDAWIGEPVPTLLGQVSVALDRANHLRGRLESRRRSQRDLEQRMDLLRHQIAEIEAVDPKAGDLEETEARVQRLQNAERLRDAAQRSLQHLREDEVNALDSVGGAERMLQDAARFDDGLQSIADEVGAAWTQLDEACRNLSHYLDDLEADPNELEEAGERLDALKRLRRKYGDDESAVLEHLERARVELATMEEDGQDEATLEAALEQAEAELGQVCGELSRLRAEKSGPYAEAVQAQIRELAMEKAVFSVRQTEREPSAQGADQIEFLFSANIGEPPRALDRIASGGELSRVMLAIKTVLAGKAGVPTLIFDEVDAGLSGRAAAVVGKKLRELSQFYQVLVISHLPQIAAQALTQVKIEKVEVQGRTRTELTVVDGKSRVEEIARLLAGEQISASALANAQEMLDAAAAFPTPKRRVSG